MRPERWARVKQVFLAALEQPADVREAFVARECAGDAEVRRKVESFLGAHDGAGSFLEGAAFSDRSTIGSDAAEAAARPSLSAGIRLGPYEIVAAIGSGSMGEVYRACDLRLGRDVAIKVLPRLLATDPVRLARFEQEVRAASALNHANIVAVYDTGWHEGMPFMVTELLEGEPLNERLARGRLPVAEAMELALQIASGLVAAHERGIVHRDLKPANLFLTEDGQVKILDFGVAKLTHAGEEASGFARTGVSTTMPGMILGTVGYMSPEQVRAESVDIRSDQFSLGCVLYEILGGQAPFRRPTAAQTMVAVLESEPRSLSDVDKRVPRPVARTVARCLAKDPDDRYPSTRGLVRDLELAMKHVAEPSLPLAAVTAAAPVRGALARSGLVLMIGAALLAGGVAAQWSGLREGGRKRPTVRAQESSGRAASRLDSPFSLAWSQPDTWLARR